MQLRCDTASGCPFDASTATSLVTGAVALPFVFDLDIGFVSGAGACGLIGSIGSVWICPWGLARQMGGLMLIGNSVLMFTSLCVKT